MSTINSAPIPVEGALLELWREAQQNFYATTLASEERKCMLESSPDPEKWLASFRKTRHSIDRSDKLYMKLYGHVDGIRLAISTINFGVRVASSVAPVVMPVTFVVNAFAWVLESITRVSEKFDKIEEFFLAMTKKFQNLSQLNDKLQDKREGPLRKRVVELFVCSLNICAIAIKDPGRRFRTWLAEVKGDDDFKQALAEFDKANDELLESVNMSTLNHAAKTNSGITRLEEKADDAEKLLVDIKKGLTRRSTTGNKWQELLNWLSELDYFKKYNELIDRVHDRPRAGTWLLESEPFIEWRDGRNDRLWYTGKPGAGKSVLATIVIRHLRDWAKSIQEPNNRHIVAYLYISNEDTLDVNLLLGSIARQVLSTYSGQANLPDEIDKTLRQYLENGASGSSGALSSPNRSDLEDVLCLAVRDKPLYVVVDAMDECKHETRKQLIKSLRKIGVGLKIMVTSRLLERQEDLAQGFAMHEIKANDQDINEYIDSFLESNRRLKKNEHRVKEEVRKRSQGMFLMTRLHMDALEGVQVDAKIESALQDLPEDPDESYSKAVDRMRQKTGETQQFAFDILAWVSFAYRPLLVDEIRYAIAYMNAAGEAQITEQALFPAAELSAYCCGLVVADVKETVSFVHYSAKTLFRSHRESLFENFHLIAAVTCARYICAIPLDKLAVLGKTGTRLATGDHSDEDDSDDSGDSVHSYGSNRRRSLLFIDEDSDVSENSKGRRSEERIERKRILRQRHRIQEELLSAPFAIYAGKFFHRHYREVRSQPKNFTGLNIDLEVPLARNSVPVIKTAIVHSEVIDRIRALAKSEITRNFYLGILEKTRSYYTMDLSLDGEDWSRRGRYYYSSSDVACQPLHMAVYLGCSAVVEELLLNELNIEELDSYNQTALTIAFKNEFDEIAGILLNKSAAVDLSVPRGHVLLLYATQMNYDRAARAIISHAARRESASTSSVLYFLAGKFAKYSNTIVRHNTLAAMLKLQADTKNNDEQKVSFFKQSCKLLLAAYDGDISALTQYVPTPRKDRESSQSQSDNHGNASWVGNIVNRLEWTKYILARDADMTSSLEEVLAVEDNSHRKRGQFLETACLLAVERGHFQAVKMLLSNGVDINVTDHRGQTLLHRATARNDIKLVEFLLEKGANVRLMDDKGRTALTGNADMDHEKVLELLLQKGANIQETGHRGVHEIYRAAAHGKTDMVKFFLKHGVPAGIYGYNGWTPLHAAAANGHLECVKLLLQANANPSPISDTGKTPLDFIRANEKHYDLESLGEISEECEAYRRKFENFPDMDERYREIESELSRKGAKTCQQLYKKLGLDERFHKPEGESMYRVWKRPGSRFSRLSERDIASKLAAEKRAAEKRAAAPL